MLLPQVPRPRSLCIILTTTELQKKPVDGFSAGLVDDDNILEWSIVIMG
jgi:ubiquitin-conjugating enzyme E2 G1